jgi:hypothetical protein
MNKVASTARCVFVCALAYFFSHAPAQVCDCTLKDSVAWLDHINGKKHNRALGYAPVAEIPLFRRLKLGLQLQHES